MLDIGQKLKKRLLVMDVYVVSAVMTGSELPESQPGNLDLFKVAWEAWGGREGGRRRRERGGMGGYFSGICDVLFLDERI